MLKRSALDLVRTTPDQRADFFERAADYGEFVLTLDADVANVGVAESGTCSFAAAAYWAGFAFGIHSGTQTG